MSGYLKSNDSDAVTSPSLAKTRSIGFKLPSRHTAELVWQIQSEDDLWTNMMGYLNIKQQDIKRPAFEEILSEQKRVWRLVIHGQFGMMNQRLQKVRRFLQTGDYDPNYDGFRKRVAGRASAAVHVSYGFHKTPLHVTLMARVWLNMPSNDVEAITNKGFQVEELPDFFELLHFTEELVEQHGGTIPLEEHLVALQDNYFHGESARSRPIDFRDNSNKQDFLERYVSGRPMSDIVAPFDVVSYSGGSQGRGADSEYGSRDQEFERDYVEQALLDFV